MVALSLFVSEKRLERAWRRKRDEGEQRASDTGERPNLGPVGLTASSGTLARSRESPLAPPLCGCARPRCVLARGSSAQRGLPESTAH